MSKRAESVKLDVISQLVTRIHSDRLAIQRRIPKGQVALCIRLRVDTTAYRMIFVLHVRTKISKATLSNGQPYVSCPIRR